MGKNLAIIFPGIGYTTEKPLLYYGLDVAYEAGYTQYRKITYSVNVPKNIRGNAEEMERVFRELYLQAKEQLRDVNWDEYDHVLFVSKSIGTIVAAAYASEYQLTRVKHVLYTPLVKTFDYEIPCGRAFIGTADGWSDYHDIVQCCAKVGIELDVYEECNHSLENEDTIGNLERLLAIMKKTREFILL